MFVFLKNTIKRGVNGIDRWSRRSILETHDHYLCFLPARPRSLTHALLRIFFRGIHMAPEQRAKLDPLAPGAILVHVTKFRSTFDFLFYHTRYLQYGKAVPELGLGYRVLFWQHPLRLARIVLARIDHLLRIGGFPDPYRRDYIKGELLAGRCAFLSLVEEKVFTAASSRLKPIRWNI